MTKGILNAAMVQELYLVVALSMALTPFLAEWGARLGKILDKKDMKTMQPQEKEVEGLSDHVIIAGFGRVGRLIAEMLSEQLIPFVALDVDANRVAVRRLGGGGKGVMCKKGRGPSFPLSCVRK